MAISASPSAMPLLYRLFFLYIEPIATAVGAYYAHYDQQAYIALTLPDTMHRNPTQLESIVLTQLANMYFAFALNEALVLRASSSRRVWRTFLFGLLLADFGHLYSVRSLGLPVYYEFWRWNSMYWGNLGFVYVGATLRICFLLGLGLS